MITACWTLLAHFFSRSALSLISRLSLTVSIWILQNQKFRQINAVRLVCQTELRMFTWIFSWAQGAQADWEREISAKIRYWVYCWAEQNFQNKQLADAVQFSLVQLKFAVKLESRKRCSQNSHEIWTTNLNKNMTVTSRNQWQHCVVEPASKMEPHYVLSLARLSEKF